MASSSSSTPSAGTQPKIIEDIVEAGKKAFDPAATQREHGVEEYNKLIERYAATRNSHVLLHSRILLQN
jgi:hypothetical protein